MASSRDRDSWSQIFKLYKGLPHLWDKNDKNYGNRSMMTDGYKVLTRVYVDKLDKQATVGALRMKMKNLRTTYYRELRKVKEAKQKACKYTPTLWYFEDMSFLNKSQASECFDDVVENKSSKGPILEPNLRVIQEEHTPSTNTPCTKTTKNSRPHYKNPPSFLQKQNSHIIDRNIKKPIKDEHWEVIGKSIGYQLQELNTKQFTIVSKLISDAIFFGRLNKLSEVSHIEIGPSNYADSGPLNVYTSFGHECSEFYESDLSVIPTNREQNIIVKEEECIVDED